MKKKILSLMATGLLLGGFTANAQLIDEKNVTVTMDLQPILQLDMSTTTQLDFVFDEIDDYYAGITQYGATILKVSSSVSFDLYAVGRSTAGTRFWDQQIAYGVGAGIANIPMSCVELRQNTANAATTGFAGGVAADYSAAFGAVGTPTATNSLYVAAGGGLALPTAADKYIAGHNGVADFIGGGSYLTATGTLAGTNNYYYSMDYRIVPGLPAVFPNASTNIALGFEDIVTANAPGDYAAPGVYTMYVQYILLENQ